MNKVVLRKTIQTIRDEMPQNQSNAFNLIIEKHTIGSQHFEGIKNIASFMSFGSEVSTLSLNQNIIKQMGRVALPKIHMPDRIMSFYWVTNLEECVKSNYGILEPSPDIHRLVDPLKLDLILTPGLAFDPKGYRLGYGGGFYDRLFSTPGLKAFRLALSYDFQRVEALPVNEFDLPVHALCTEKGITVFE